MSGFDFALRLSVWFFVILFFYFVLYIYMYTSKRPFKKLRKAYLWKFNTGNRKTIDTKGYEEQLFKISVVMCIISVLFIFSVYLIEKTGITYRILYISFISLIILVMYSGIKLRNYY